MSSPCPDLEVLFEELAEGTGQALAHSRTCPSCSAVLEEHRQLEKDLYRLQDPLPPADLVPGVMARVAKSPAPASVELRTGVGIISVALGLAATILVARGATAGQFGVAFAQNVLELRSVFVGVVTGIEGVWSAAALPLAAAVAVVLMLSLAGLKKLAGTELTAKA